MNALIDKNITQSQFPELDEAHVEEILTTKRPNPSFLLRVKQWLHLIRDRRREPIVEGRIVFADGNLGETGKIMCVTDIPFVIPRQIDEVREAIKTKLERTRLIVRRMDEYLVSPEDQNEAKRRRHEDTSLGLLALAQAVNSIQKIAFREVLSVDETLPAGATTLTEGTALTEKLLRQSEKIDPITDFQEAHDLVEFEEALATHRTATEQMPASKPFDRVYLKFCLLLEIQRDPDQSCLHIFLHDIIFKFHLVDFRLRCEIHLQKPIEQKLVIDKVVHGSHLNQTYAGEFALWSGDWIAQQEVELYVVMKIESISINRYIGAKFWDMAHLHVKNVPHGASKIFLRELTPVYRPHKILSRGSNVGQIEIEASHWPDRRELVISILKVSHSQAERFLREPETYVEVVFQGPFDIYEIQRTKVADRSLNPKFNEEFSFYIPEKTAVSDVTIDLVFMEKPSLHHHPTVLGVLTLSKHTDWFPVRKFWALLEEFPNLKHKDRFLFEGDVDE